MPMSITNDPLAPLQIADCVEPVPMGAAEYRRPAILHSSFSILNFHMEVSDVADRGRRSLQDLQHCRAARWAAWRRAGAAGARIPRGARGRWGVVSAGGRRDGWLH